MHNEKEGMPVTALREIKILKALQHPCIVDILDMFVVRSEWPFSSVSIHESQSAQVQRRILYLSTWSFLTWTMIWLGYWRMNGSSYSQVISSYI